MDTGRMFGYCRVSTQSKQESSLEQQKQSLLEAGIRERDIFSDRGSGRTSWSKRPGLREAVESLAPGDTLVICALDRLGRNLPDVRALIDALNGDGIHLRILNLGPGVGQADTRDISGKILLNVLSMLSEMESDIRGERARAGHAARKRRLEAAGEEVRGSGGRKPKLSRDEVKAALEQINSGIPASLVAEEAGVSRATLYSRLKAEGLNISRAS